MHNWKCVNLSKMTGFNISLSLNERQSSSDKKHNKSLRLVLFIPFRCCFAGSLPFSLSTVKQTKLSHSISEMFFTFLTRKTLWVKLFSLNVCEAALQAAIKGWNFGAKLKHLCGFWLDVSFFSHVKKHRLQYIAPMHDYVRRVNFTNKPRLWTKFFAFALFVRWYSLQLYCLGNSFLWNFAYF